MAIYDAGARFDNDSYYQMSVNEETEEAMITGEKNGEPVESATSTTAYANCFIVSSNMSEPLKAYGKAITLTFSN